MGTTVSESVKGASGAMSAWQAMRGFIVGAVPTHERLQQAREEYTILIYVGDRICTT
jgi:hypothetical protein